MKTIIIIISVCTVLLALPRWVHDPSMGGMYIGAVGSALKMQNTKTQERIALLNAKSELSQINHVNIESHDTISSDNLGSDTSFKDTFQSQSTLKTTILDTYRDQEGTLYIWLIQNEGNK